MRSMFVSSGIHNQRDTSWMGQAATTTTPVSNEWTALNTGIKAISTGFTDYEKEQIAEENRRAAQAAADAAASAARTAQIQQQTTGMQIAATTKIMGLDKPVFYLGAVVVLTALLGGAFVLMKGK